MRFEKTAFRHPDFWIEFGLAVVYFIAALPLLRRLPLFAAAVVLILPLCILFLRVLPLGSKRSMQVLRILFAAALCVVLIVLMVPRRGMVTIGITEVGPSLVKPLLNLILCLICVVLETIISVTKRRIRDV